EFACGACHGLDEYTMYLTPAQLDETRHGVEGASLAVGLDVRVENGRAVITHVESESAAARAGTTVGAELLRIDGANLMGQSEESIRDLLQRRPGGETEIAILVRDGETTKVVRLARQLNTVSSVVQAQMLPEQQGIGYCRIMRFQRGTWQ